MKQDEFDEVLNGEETYKEIAKVLYDKNNVLIGWTDGRFDHRDIFFSCGTTEKYGNIQRGIKSNYLFVGIIDFGFTGFRADTTKHYGYILEKLRLEENATNIKIAELINGVIKALGGTDE